MWHKVIYLKFLFLWVFLAIIITVAYFFIYTVVQQSYRLSANDPQIQMAEDAKLSIENGTKLESIIPQRRVDMSNSLDPYLIIFDELGVPIMSSVKLDGVTPKPPIGVFTDAKTKGSLTFTWQPKPGVRSAVVVMRFNGINSGYVLAGRSLREVEKREDQLFLDVVIVWFGTVLVTFIMSLAAIKLFKES